MRKYIIAILLFIAQNTFSQISSVENDTIIYNQAEIDLPPKFPGGPAELYKYINENLSVKNKEIKQKVFVRFVVEINGTLNNIEFVRQNPDEETSNKIIKVLQMCPKWNSGEHNGKKVRALYSIPINI